MRFLLLVFYSFVHLTLSAQYLRQDTVLVTPSGKLAGTFIIPDSPLKHALVIVQPGSGPTDRYGNSGMGLKTDSYKLLAEALAKEGIATLLVDKRGVGGSMGAIKKEADLRFDDYADDLAAWAALAKTDKRFSKIIIAGHSEGSLVGMLAAQKQKVAGYISIAGAGESIDKIITWQYRQQAPKAGNIVDSLFNKLKNKEQLDSIPSYLLSIFRPSVQPYIFSWMMHNPCDEIQKLKIPTLIIQGTTDFQVEVKQAEMLKVCNPTAGYTVIEGMNHILKAAPIDRAKNMATYNKPELPIVPELVNTIVNFVTSIK